MSRRTKRVPAKLHNELTEYASLLRALRTRHTLDLSAHLSQLTPTPSSPRDGESELSLSDWREGEEEGQRYETTTSLQPISDLGADDASVAYTLQSTNDDIRQQSSSPITTEHPDVDKDKTPTCASISLADKKRKRQTTDTWTRWPLLAGDVYHPEWGLADEVQLIASYVLKQQQQQQHQHSISPEHSQHSSSDADSNFEDEDLDDDDEEDEIGIRALSACTAEHLCALLSACSAYVPRVEPSLRSRLAPLNWKSVLAAAGANGLVSPETLDRVGERLEALYNSDHAPGLNSITSPSRLASYTHHVHAASAVQTARENLRSLFKARVEHGDGDFLTFLGPLPPPKKKTKKKRVRNGRKEDETPMDKQVKKQELEEMDEEIEPKHSHSTSDASDGEARSKGGEEG